MPFPWGHAVVRAMAPASACVLAAIAGDRTAAEGFAAVAGLVLVIGVAVPRLLEPVDRAVGLVSRALTAAVSAVVLTLVWLLTIAPAWIVSFIDREVRPKARNRRSTWWPGHGSLAGGAVRRARPRRMWAQDGAPSRRRAWLLPLGCLAVGALAAVAVTVGVDHSSSDTTSDAAPPAPTATSAPGQSASASAPTTAPPSAGHHPRMFAPADQAWVVAHVFGGAPWANELFNERGAGIAVPDPLRGWRMLDAAGKYLNVVGGHRVSYEPPNPVLTVWFFGGSTTFGDGQRDLYTIPSDIARLAQQRGVNIKVVNFGVDGYNNYQETMDFAAALTTMTPPDVAVFYDGANEWSTTEERLDYGDDDPTQIYFPAANDQQRADRAASAKGPKLSDADRARLFVSLGAAQYKRGVQLADQLGKAYGVSVMHYWQPGIYSAPISAPSEVILQRSNAPTDAVKTLGLQMADMRTASGTNPIDLGLALAGVNVPVYMDMSHTNEVGANIIATKMFATLGPVIQEARPGH